MKKVIRFILKWVTAPIVIPVMLIYGHWRWLEDDDVPYSWVWLVPFHDYLLGREPK